MNRFLRSVDSILKWLVIVFMGANVINVLWQVFTRFVLDSPSTFTEELARYLLIWVSFLGAAYAYRKRIHLAVEVITQKLSERSYHYVQIFIQACIFLFSLLVLVIGGIDLTYMSFAESQISPALQINIGYIYMVIPLSGILFLYYSLVFIREYLKQLRGEESELLNELQTREPQTAE